MTVPLLSLLWASARVVAAAEDALPQAVLAAVEGDLDFSSPLPIKGRDMVYRAEPEYKGKVIRGGITIGPDPTDVLGFAWDQKADRLYLDTNRNFDLTDDGEGWAPDQESYQWVAVFKDLRYEVHKGEARIPYRFTLQFNRTWEDRATLIVQSGWQGQLNLGEESWTVTWVDDLDGQMDAGDLLLLVPGAVEARNNPLPEHVLQPAFSVPCNSQLSLNGKMYRITTRFDAPEGTVGGQVQMLFTPITPATATMQFEGRNVFRVVLKGSQWGVALDRPENGTYQVPVGDYTEGTIVLDGNRPELWFHTALEAVTVTAGKTTVLRAGGPLDNTANASLNGGMLRLEYRLKGIGGRRYEPYTTGTAAAPKVTFSRGGEEIHAANFEYG